MADNPIRRVSDPISDTEALNRIHRFMDATEWDAGTIEVVAEILALTGRTIRPPEQYEPTDAEMQRQNPFAL